MSKKSGNNRTAFLAIILAALLVIAYKVVFVAPPPLDEEVYDEYAVAVSRVEELLVEVEGINFDTSVFESPTFQSFQNIDSPLTPLPKGKINPFAR